VRIRSQRDPQSSIRWFRLSAGPLLTLVVAMGIELLRATPLHLPGPGIPLLVVVAWSVYTGGFVPGLASAALAVGYAWHYYSGTPPAGITLDELRRVLDLGLGALSLVVMLGLLRRRAERARRLETSAAVAMEQRIVLEEAADPLLIADASGHYVFVNQRACEMSGYARDELLRMRIGDLFMREGGPVRVIETMPGEARHLDVELVRRDGTRIHAALSVRKLSDGRTLKLVRDVTERRAAIDRLQGALSLVRATLESTTDGILVVDSTGKWAGHNSRFRELWRIPEDIEQAGDDVRALEYVVGQLVSPEEFVARVRELYATPEAISHDDVHLKDGRVIERYSIPQRIGDLTVGRVWSFRDVTGMRRQAEALRETERRFIEAEKLETVGLLAGGVAHDFNNMLTAILGEAELLLLQASLDAQARAQVESIHNAAQRSAALTRQLLTFARRQHTAPRAFSLAGALEEIDPLIRRLAGRQVDVRLDLACEDSGPWVYADTAQFEQAILNLVVNAGDAMPGGGSLALTLCREDVDETDAARRGAPAAGRYACVCIEDTGSGIPDHVLPHLFEPFFTTKPPGKGTGLGLASVHGIIQAANGFVEVASEMGRGTTFRVLIPEYVYEPQIAPAGRATAQAAKGLRNASVLVVDDEQHVRRLVVAALEGAGCDVLHAESATAAMEIASARPDAIDLLLTDVLMPETSGPALARALLERRQVRRVMFMSGYPGRALTDDPGDLASLGRVEMIHKPFRSGELLERVRLALEGAELPLPR
jgi:two-component system, cell cycle sensor histidine kinase and response regulator CckA